MYFKLRAAKFYHHHHITIITQKKKRKCVSGCLPLACCTKLTRTHPTKINASALNQIKTFN